MPTTLTEITGKVQDQVLEALKAGQEAVVDTVTTVAETVKRVLPEQARGPLAANLPLATEAADQAFGFAGKVLDAQHKFVNRVITAVTPKSAPAPKAAPKTATKASSAA